MINICQIIQGHIEAAENYIEKPSEGALLFEESNFLPTEWDIQTTSGYSSTMPMFLYILGEMTIEVKPVSTGELVLFMRKVYDKM